MYQWFATTLVYYGLSLGAGSLGNTHHFNIRSKIIWGGNLLINNLLNGLVEFVCYCFLPLFMDIRCIGRKYGVIVTMFIGSVGCFLAATFGELARNEGDKTTQETYDLCMVSSITSKEKCEYSYFTRGYSPSLENSASQAHLVSSTFMPLSFTRPRFDRLVSQIHFIKELQLF